MKRRKGVKVKGREVLPALAEPERGIPRHTRVEGQVHAEVMAVLPGLEDPRLVEVTVTRVRMTDDLQLARVYVHAAGLDEDQGAAREKGIMLGLESAAGRLRRRLGQVLQLRYTPQLRFYYDHGVSAARRVDELLSEIDADDAARAPELADADASPADPDSGQDG